ncbi:MAG: TorF family putative porin [Comamonas sp.]|nr:TorF family putative porin [Comamonas sp.]
MLRALLKSFCLALAVAAAPMLANAQLTANLSLTSNYKVRGQDQDVNRVKAVSPAVQGGLDYAFGASGFYVGNWNSSVDWLAGNAIESDLYGGYRFKAGGLDLDVGALTYLYPGNSSGNTTELYGSITRGPFTVKYSHTVSRDYFGWASAGTSGKRGRNTGYLNLAFVHEVAPKYTLRAAMGYTRFASDIRGLGVPNYMDYQLGGAHDLGDGLSLSAVVAGASRRGFFGDANKARLIVTLTKTL